MRVRGWPAGIRALWAALVLFTLLAFIWQGFVTQAHRHAGGAAYSLSLAAKGPGSVQAQKSGQAPSDTPDNCPICQEIAHGGAYLAPAPVLFFPPATLADWFALPLLLALVLRQQSHDWRSRAPPLRFQA